MCKLLEKTIHNSNHDYIVNIIKCYVIFRSVDLLEPKTMDQTLTIATLFSKVNPIKLVHGQCGYGCSSGFPPCGPEERKQTGCNLAH